MSALPILPVDFGNCDPDGSVRLVTKGVTNFINEHSLQLRDGLNVIISDDELYAIGEVSWRDGIWVVMVKKWIKDPRAQS